MLQKILRSQLNFPLCDFSIIVLLFKVNTHKSNEYSSLGYIPSVGKISGGKLTLLDR